MVIALLAAANRDETVFPDPDRFDIGRAGNGRHLALGFGLHYCLGASLARLETKIAVNAILRLLGVERADGVAPQPHPA